LNKRVAHASLAAVMVLLGGAFFTASAMSSTCSGGASLSGWYGMLVSGGGKYLTGAIYFDGNCNVSGNNVTGSSGGQYVTTGVTGTYGQNSDGTFTITLNFPGQSTPGPSMQTYMVGVSESGNKARGLESDSSVMATVDVQSQLTSLTSGYSAGSLNGTYAASCYGGSEADLNYLTFDGQGNVSGVDYFDNGGGQGSNQIQGTYSVNGDGTFSGSLAGSYSFAGVIDNGISEIEYTYYESGSGGVLACVGKQSTGGSLAGYYGFVVGGNAQSGGGGKYLSGSIYLNGAGGLTGNSVNGGINEQYGNTSVTGSYSVNPDNTISVTMNLANQTTAQTYVVGVSESGNEAIGIENDNTAIATIDLQNQLWPSSTPPYSNASLNGTYAASCSGAEVDLNYVTFDGNGNITAGVDAFYDGWYGDNPYTGTYTVNGDGTFSGNFPGPIYDIFTMTGVLDNGTAEIEYTYYQSGVGGVVSCVGESTYGPIGTNPAAATPALSPAPGSYTSPQTVTLSDTTSGATIYYTTNGATPTVESPVYNGPFQVSATTTVQAMAVASGYNNSAIAPGTYFLSQSHNQGQNENQTVTFPAIGNQTYPAGPFILSATASSGLPMSYAVLSGPATISGNLLTITGAGFVTVQASQAGNAQYAPANAVTQTFIVNQASTTLVLTSSSNPSSLDQSVTLAATIMPQNGGQVSGTITFKDGSAVLSVVAVSGNLATLTTSTLAVGTHSISVVYSGDSNFIGSAATPLAQSVTKATTNIAVVSSLNPARSGQAVNFGVTVSSSAVVPTGSVQLLNGTTVLAKLALKAGAVKYTTAKLPAGSNVITAVYVGDANNNGSASASLNQFVVAATTTAVTSSPNPSVYGQTVVFSATITSSLGGPPDGETVTFKQGANVLGTGLVSGGTATFSASTLAVGTKLVTAVYGGDADFAASTSKAASQVIGKAATTIEVSSSQNPATFGQPTTFNVTVTPQFSGVPTGTVTFLDGAKVLKTVTLSEGAASFTTSTLTRGVHNITAKYNASTSFDGNSGLLSETVN
jgi:hypothetical protein